MLCKWDAFCRQCCQKVQELLVLFDVGLLTSCACAGIVPDSV